MIPDRHTGQARYWVFRGKARDGQEVAWGTAEVLAPAGPVEHRLVEPPQGYEVGPTTIVGAEPPRTSTTLTVADPDGRLATLLLPERVGTVGLTGKLYLGEIRGEQIAEAPVTPTMVLAGSVQSEGYALRVPLEVDDSAVLGRSIAVWTVEEILSGQLLAVEDRDARLGDYLAGAGDDELWFRMRSQARDNLDVIVPWAYGPAIAPLISIRGDYPRWWISVVADTALPTWGPGSRTLLMEREGDVVPVQPTWLEQSLSGPATPARFVARVLLEDRAGRPREVRVLAYCMPEPPESSDGGTYYERLAPLQADRSLDSLGMMFGWGSPPAAVLALITGHTDAGFGRLHQASWERVIREVDPTWGDTVAGLFGSEGATIAEVLPYLAATCGLRIWMGVDDLLHAAIAGYTMQDAQAAQDDLLELQEMDIYPGGEGGAPVWSTTIIGDVDDDGAGVSRVSVEWSDLQRKVWPLETSATLPDVRGLLHQGRERILSGAWLRPDRGRDIAVAVQSSTPGDAVRVEIATHLSLAKASPADLIRVSHPIGVGIPGQGWDKRLARVESINPLPSEDAVRLLLTDLGLAERMRLGLLDAWQQWALYLPQPGDELELTVEGGEMRIEGVVAAYPEWDHETMTLWMPGALDPRLRGSWRATRMEGDTVIVVLDHDPGPVQEIVDPLFADPIVGAGWAVMRTDLLDPAYRDQYVRGADLESGFLESGREGFVYAAY